MYVPGYADQAEEKQVREVIEQNGFATVLSFPQNEMPFINHLPIIFSPKAGEEKILIGHMAKRNPQWRHFQQNPNCVLIFNGPHTYITPNWYRSGRDVPTWNYAVVHMQGKIELVEGFKEQIQVLKDLSEYYEKPSAKPWEFELPDDLLDADALTSAIISFKFHIEKVEPKFKFSQNRGQEDRLGVIEGLAERTDDQSKAVRKIMMDHEETLGKK